MLEQKILKLETGFVSNKTTKNCKPRCKANIK